MPPKEEATQITIGGKTITQVAELSAVPEVGAMKWRNQLLKRAIKAQRGGGKMRYNEFYACPYCGSALDPGERCDCQDQKEKEGKYADSKDTTRKDAGASEHRAIQIAG